MHVPATALIASPQRLIAAIVMFVALDLTVLVTNFWIADQIALDAVAINLAGRQRMLSQQTTKALVLASHADTPERAAAARTEALEAFGLLDRTLTAFAVGGETLGSDGVPVKLGPVSDDATHLVQEARGIVAPMRDLLLAPQGADYPRAAAYAVEQNRPLLTLMNQLTTALEHQSVRYTHNLRLIQSAAFVLALANFLVIVLGLARNYRQMQSESQRWRELARHDALTGLANRKAFCESAEGLLARAAVSGDQGAVMILDLDGFKPINDRHGHATGDQILIRLADALESTARATDIVARLGGDEFAILCPNLHSPEHLAQFCQRLVGAIAAIPDSVCPGNLLGASIGIAVYPEDGYDLDALLSGADRAMYAAKQAGGSRWHTA